MQDKRYVVQQHRTPDGIHWDLMLERDDALTTFRLEEMPVEPPGQKIRAEKIFDHPLRFLTYEGPVQQGTGQVRIVDRGTCHIKAHSAKEITLYFSGGALGGSFRLTHTHEAFWELARADGSTQG